MKIDDNFYMRLAIDEAWKHQLLTYPNPAVGCVIVKNQRLLAVEAHKEAGMPHAEVNALKTAYLKDNPNSILKTKNSSFDIHQFLLQNHNGFFNDCEIYVTLEPCNHIGKTPSCANLLKELKPKRVIISVKDPNKQATGGLETLKNENINVTLGILEKDGLNLILPFISWQNKSCIFFKMAQTLNGSIDGKISSNRALAYVHTLRDKIDLLVIGGNSVRIDKPTLDTRYIQGKNPDIFIYSKNKVFDTNIPLFKIPNRKVLISDDLYKLLDYKFIMIEGVYNLLDKLKERIDFFILIISPKIRKGQNALNEIDLDFEIIHENFIGEDKIVFLKRK
ncbi:bifunctional diaminohydroxyphosphoribosylaminopyrimidine deaminase/5-amino-6-(5-phosphoribosylamino)uracil reductase RibD [Aliarcobacter butzleri]|uniref:Bifunctional diaminohydroxyphosphoribosylaminopyrimidine deaminase/5-amino-6-(5-phosphoribosylamino)uracil reductase RibD n=1 Tax=Aliarcobacter butzleri TaxID=28197 RepID=A0AAW6VLT6_9BACT|nr:bifunctional diaminohydroxyphosphoribosylaminopyrimidine deaminase/5-amino-6-(5-phosphoribosylamino)uracil reductase RibD [Aliarcobacter butzleri]MDK2061958.1 bifunctional diaminohydroxyphosphoribosylaminopyrimidine deaminase/5-amino-6-(5-phosphoribosylamino)uracil reductase RibD [Aliarcobacter butzleri]MDK2064046.1 bifunctional diaminohydroxyphosphoribosylaminopyrimidine deaminase/5-amino-6-(5-phosphoribosylamino)uracil reductase RibD [Aliarcobacter butzleri]MDK2069920.1 bifunctional diamino